MAKQQYCCLTWLKTWGDGHDDHDTHSYNCNKARLARKGSQPKSLPVVTCSCLHGFRIEQQIYYMDPVDINELQMSLWKFFFFIIIIVFVELGCTAQCTQLPSFAFNNSTTVYSRSFVLCLLFYSWLVGGQGGGGGVQLEPRSGEHNDKNFSATFDKPNKSWFKY